MVARLKLISSRIPWSLLLKAAVLAVGFALLPFWAFGLLAILIYCLPFFRVRTFLPEFVLILVLAATFPGGGWTAPLFFALFLLLFGMKDLVIVGRSRGYEAMLLLLALLGSIAFYGSAAGNSFRGPVPFLLAMGMGVIAALLLRRIPFEESGTGQSDLFAAVSGFLVFQLAFLLLFLPFNFLEAAAVLFTFIAGLITALTVWRRGERGQYSIFTSFALFAAAVFATLLLAPWRI